MIYLVIIVSWLVRLQSIDSIGSSSHDRWWPPDKRRKRWVCWTCIWFLWIWIGGGRKEEDGLEDIDDRYEEDEDVGEDEMNHLHFNHSIILLIYFWFSFRWVTIQYKETKNLEGIVSSDSLGTYLIAYFNVASSHFLFIYLYQLIRIIVW